MSLLPLLLTLPILCAGAARTPSPRSSEHCLAYEPAVVELSGTLRRQTFPGPPNYEDVGRGDQPETGYYLHLEHPVCAEGTGELLEPRRDVRVVQLVLDAAGYAAYRKRLDTRVTLRGTLFSAYDAHHHAPLLLEVRPDPTPARPRL